MNNLRTNVLVTDGDSRQILPVLKGLHNIDCQVTTVSFNRLDNGYTSRYSNRKLLFPRDKKRYMDCLIKELCQNHYDVVIPLSDRNTDLFTEHQEDINQYTKLASPARDVFMKAYDKQATMEACMRDGIPCPISRKQNESIEGAILKIGFPMVAKPRMACGSKGLKIIRNEKELWNLIESGVVDPTQYIIQQYIPQTDRQINVHAVMDKQGALVSCVVTEKCRWYPVDGGASCLCRTIHDETILLECERLLKSIGWYGYCEIELIIDPRDNLAKVMEINGRASASIKITQLAGVNVAKQMLEIAMDLPAENQLSYSDDIRLRRITTDCLWFLQSSERFSKKPSWFSLAHTHEATFDIQDPLPFFGTAVNLAKNVTSFRDEMQQRNRT